MVGSNRSNNDNHADEENKVPSMRIDWREERRIRQLTKDLLRGNERGNDPGTSSPTISNQDQEQRQRKGQEQRQDQRQQQNQEHQDQDLTNRRGGGSSVVDDHRSPFSGGGHPQHGTSSPSGEVGH